MPKVVAHINQDFDVRVAGMTLKVMEGAKKKKQQRGRVKLQSGVIEWYELHQRYASGQVSWDELVDFLKQHPPKRRGAA